ncbi:MAG: twin-arginine translocation signal domain-containing protein, partial [Eggerthella sp.]|nr:twin-arginine translocation signal domain-containing protein [Eggerthella sp.]
MTMNESSVSRRTFVKGSLAGLALAGAAGSTALYGCAPKDEKGAASEGAGASTDQISWSQCNVNCGGNCVFQWHSQDGKIVYMESDNT